MNTSKPRLIIYGAENRKRLLAGASMFSKAVCTTYGPHGRIVMLNRTVGLLSTKDGVTVAREINFEDPVANMACQVFKSACIKVNDEAGDGTTTTACISAAVLQEACMLIESGMNPVHMARGVQMAAQAACNAIWDLAMPIETQSELERVALISSNGDQDVAEKLAEAVMAVGKNGTVSIEDGHGIETVLLFKEGMEIDRGAASAHFLKDQNERELDGPLVAVVAAHLRTIEDVLSMCEEATAFNGRPLLIFCEGIEGEALKTLIMNDSAKSEFSFVAVLSPGNFDRKIEYLGDIAALAGADLIDPKQGGQWTQWDANWFGGLRTARVEAKKTTLVAYDEASDTIKNRIAEIVVSRKFATSQYDTDRINERLATMEGGLCIMQIGATTESELKEKRARVEDALGSVQAALRDGIVPGGGTAYLAAYQAIKGKCPVDDLEVMAGWGCLERALLRPLNTLAKNAGKNGDYLVEKLLEARQDASDWLGWDALVDEFRDFSLDTTIIDPCKVAIAVIEAASSATSTLMTAEASISDYS